MLSEQKISEIEKRAQTQIDLFKSVGWDGVDTSDFTDPGLLWCIDVPELIAEIRSLRKH